MRVFVCLALAALTACSTPDLIAVTAPEVTERVKIRFGSVEVRDVSLPSYAADDKVSVQAGDGTVTTVDVQWADEPERAVALQLTETLTRLTGARIASEPWPFESFPDARLLVRFSSLGAGEDGQFRAKGQYFVGVPDGGRERSGLFDLSVPFDPQGGAAAIAQARGQIIRDLATHVARKGLR